MPHVSLDEAAVVGGGEDSNLVALDDAMNDLARIDPRKVQVVEMRFFGGLSVEEIAEVLQISSVTVKRDWRAARASLIRSDSEAGSFLENPVDGAPARAAATSAAGDLTGRTVSHYRITQKLGGGARLR